MLPSAQPRPWPPEDEELVKGPFNVVISIDDNGGAHIARQYCDDGHLIEAAEHKALERQLAVFKEEAQTWLDLTNSLNAEIGSLQKQLEGVNEKLNQLKAWCNTGALTGKQRSLGMKAILFPEPHSGQEVE